MTATSEWKGRPIAYINDQWVFTDNLAIIPPMSDKNDMTLDGRPIAFIDHAWVYTDNPVPQPPDSSDIPKEPPEDTGG